MPRSFLIKKSSLYCIEKKVALVSNSDDFEDCEELDIENASDSKGPFDLSTKSRKLEEVVAKAVNHTKDDCSMITDNTSTMNDTQARRLLRNNQCSVITNVAHSNALETEVTESSIVPRSVSQQYSPKIQANIAKSALTPLAPLEPLSINHDTDAVKASYQQLHPHPMYSQFIREYASQGQYHIPYYFSPPAVYPDAVTFPISPPRTPFYRQERISPQYPTNACSPDITRHLSPSEKCESIIWSAGKGKLSPEVSPPSSSSGSEYENSSVYAFSNYTVNVNEKKMSSKSSRIKKDDCCSEVPSRYQCADCKKSYSTLSGLTKHQEFHCSTQAK
ncbi:protein escargot-like protein, partial [Leptotrombidium deliense]